MFLEVAQEVHARYPGDHKTDGSHKDPHDYSLLIDLLVKIESATHKHVYWS